MKKRLHPDTIAAIKKLQKDNMRMHLEIEKNIKAIDLLRRTKL